MAAEVIIIIIIIIVAADAVGPEESVSECAGTVHLRVAEPRRDLPVLALGHGFVLLAFGSGRGLY